MNKRNWLWIGGGLLIVIVLIIGMQQLLKSDRKAEAITKEEAQRLVEETYSGDVTEVVLENSQYKVDLDRETGTYQVEIDVMSGEILSLNRTKIKKEELKEESVLNEEEIKAVIGKSVTGKLESIEQVQEGERPIFKAKVKDSQEQNTVIVTVDGISGKILKSETTKNEEPPKGLTEKEATNIALQQVQGEVDDIETETVNGVTYYFIEIESDNDQDATVQINAITGEIRSIAWDD